MGLLDIFNSDEGRLGLSLLGAAGPSSQNFAGRMAQAGQSFQGMQQDQIKSQLMRAQIGNFQSEGEARKLKLLQDQRQQALIAQILGPQGASAPQVSPGAFAPAADGYGPTMPPSMSAQGQPGSRMANLSFDQLGALKMGGLDLTDLHKYANDPRKLEGGSTYENRVSGQREYMPKLPDGMANNGHGFYDFVPGYEAGMTRLEGAKVGAAEDAKAGRDLVQVAGPDGAMRFVPRSQVLAGAQPQQPAMRNLGGGSIAPELAQFIRADAARNGIASPQANFSGGSPAATYGLAGGQAAPAQSGSAGVFQATPTTAQSNSAIAGKDVNKSWITTRYEPALAAGDAAKDLMETVQVTRQAMSNLGGTGWTTQTKAAGAAILTGLGVGPKNAEMFASNAEVFQSKVVERINAELNAAKGPQTDQDAVRATKTYASLKNTTRANEFILDYAEAKAQRDQIKGKFYQQALPIAQQKGDLSEVDREWAKLSPSIFTMPSLQRWAGGVK